MPESIALNCDCMEYMRALPDKAFDVVVGQCPTTSPKRHGTNGRAWTLMFAT